jgi:hypothetical protein
MGVIVAIGLPIIEMMDPISARALTTHILAVFLFGIAIVLVLAALGAAIGAFWGAVLEYLGLGESPGPIPGRSLR